MCSAQSGAADTVIDLKHIGKRFIQELPVSDGLNRFKNTGSFDFPKETAEKRFFFSFFRKNRGKVPGKTGDFYHYNKKKDSKPYFYALDDVSLSVKRGECVLVAGANGSGKTLLMMIIAQLVKPSLGSIEVKEPCGLVFQDADLQILGETPEEDIEIGLKNLDLSEDELRRRTDEALERTGLTEKRYFSARFFSGGEKRRLAVAGILAMGFPIIIFDEPYANLDYSGVRQVNELIQMLKKSGHTVLILTHELEKCCALTGRAVVLHGGKKVFDGTSDKMLHLDLAQWNIRNPLCSYIKKEDLVWL